MVSLAEVVGSAAADRGPRRLDAGRLDRDPRSGADTARLVRRGRRRRRRRSGRTSRAPTRTRELVEINVRRSVFYPTEHHLDYITVRGFELAQAAVPVDAADRRPARPHRPELGEGLDHRGQRHPRREVLGRLARQGGLDRPQLRDRAPRQARLPVPARVGLLRPPDRLGPRARRLARRPPQHHLRLRPERHRRPPRLRVLDDRGQPHLQHRPQARVLRLRDRRHQAPRGDRRRHPPQPHPRLLARRPGWTGRRRAPASRATSSTPTTATCSSRSATARTSSTTTSSPRPSSLEVFSQGGAFVNNLVCGTVAARPGRRPADALPRAAQHAGRGLRRDPRRRRPLHRQRLPRRRRQPRPTGRRAVRRRRPGTAPPATTAIPASLADYLALVDDPSRGDHERFTGVKQPVYIRDNVYAAGRRRVRGRTRSRSCSTADVRFAVVDEGDEVYLETRLPEDFDRRAHRARSPGRDLERVRFVDAEFEERDGSPALLDTDLVGEPQDRRADLPGRPDRRARLGLVAHAGVVMDEDVLRARVNMSPRDFDELGLATPRRRSRSRSRRARR